ncbi:hypothetical protein B0A50_01845 [Salinomyces thailandicus]|uniref:AB hydrolase-1 domain-containing protein n=1 Tax=Salinomyces thailandicus TaxID=706561 RepID=A0A4U0U9J6_9PEZI|nr:hypothetical protein B0A50_01845 [Salinomyces thailandica]
MNGPGYLAVAIQPGPQTDPKAFHEWYNEEHGPLRLRLPYITTGDRYQATDGQNPEWSAVYDVSELAELEKRLYTRLREERSAREKAVMSTFESLDRKIYRTIASRGSVGDAPAPITVAVSIRVNEADLDDFGKWYDEEHTPMLSKIPGWLRTRRFEMVVGGLKGMPPSGQIECLAVHDFAAQNGLNGPEHQAAQSTPWRTSVMNKIVSKDRRQWTHHLRFDALEEPTSTVITTDGAHLRYQLEGNPADPVLVFINSILTNLHIWDDVATHLRTKGLKGQTYRILRYNSRGYSQHSSNSNPPTFDLLASDLEYLLQRLKLSQAHAVIGVSMGGVTALTFALNHPSLLQKFVACDCNTASSPANTAAWQDRINLARTQGMPALASATMQRWFTPANHASPAAARVQTMIQDASLEGFAANTGALCDYDLKSRLPEMKVPGLLIAGEGDGKLPEAMQKFGIPGTDFKSVEGAGHLPMVENFEGFIKVLEGFL